MPVPRFALGTTPPPDLDERPTDHARARPIRLEQQTLARGSKPRQDFEPDPLPAPPTPSEIRCATGSRPKSEPKLPRDGEFTPVPKMTVKGAQPLHRPLTQGRAQRGPIPELPGFGEYLVETGILTRERLRAAQAYQRSMRVQLSTAIVTLGLATPQRIEWAAVAHQSQLARQR